MGGPFGPFFGARVVGTHHGLGRSERGARFERRSQLNLLLLARNAGDDDQHGLRSERWIASPDQVGVAMTPGCIDCAFLRRDAKRRRQPSQWPHQPATGCAREHTPGDTGTAIKSTATALPAPVVKIVPAASASAVSAGVHRPDLRRFSDSQAAQLEQGTAFGELARTLLGLASW